MPLDHLQWRRPDHPWLGEFEQEPETQFDAIIRGVALIPPYGLADPLTVIPSLFGPLHPDDPLMRALDLAAIGWLDARKQLPLEERRRYGHKRYWSDVVDALALVQRMRIPATRAALRDRYFEFLQWVDDHRLSSSIDPRARLWLALTSDQPTPRFRSLWHRICRQTGEDIYPYHYLNIGLLGLRRLPHKDDSAALREVLGGLATWAAFLPDHQGAKQQFLTQWGTLQWIYTLPGRKPWHGLVEPIVRAHRDKPFAKWWAADLGIRLDTKPSPKTLAEPSPSEVFELIDRLRHNPVDQLRHEIERVVQVRLDYAQATGNSYYLVRTAANIGSRIIDADPALTVDLVTQALDWAPNDPILWNLWGRGLVGLGRTRLAEAVFWEAARRFPDDERNEATFVELARLLKALGRADEAEAVLREAVSRFPNNEPVRVELARLLAATGRPDSAIALLREAAAAFKDDGQIHVEAARMLARQGRWTEAIALLRGFIARHQDDRIAITTLGHLLVNSGKLEDAVPLLDDLRALNDHRGAAELSKAIATARAGHPVPMPPPNYRIELPARDAPADDRAVAAHHPLATDARVTRADFGLSEAGAALPAPHREELRQDLRTVLAEEPDHGYARIVYFDRVLPPTEEAQGLLADFPRLYELRLLAALRHRDAASLGRLTEDVPERAPVTRLALAALDAGNGKYLDESATWLIHRTPPADDLLGAYVHRATRTALERQGIDLGDQTGVSAGLSAIAGDLTDILIRATRLVGTQDRAA